MSGWLHELYKEDRQKKAVRSVEKNSQPPKTKFDRVAYQRDYMRKRRAFLKLKKDLKV